MSCGQRPRQALFLEDGDEKCVRMTKECKRATVASIGWWVCWKTGVLTFSRSWQFLQKAAVCVLCSKEEDRFYIVLLWQTAIQSSLVPTELLAQRCCTLETSFILIQACCIEVGFNPYCIQMEKTVQEPLEKLRVSEVNVIFEC